MLMGDVDIQYLLYGLVLISIVSIVSIVHLTRGRVCACRPVENIFQAAEAKTSVGHILPDAASVEVVRHWPAGGVTPHVDRVLGGGGVGGLRRAPWHRWGLQLWTQHLKVSFIFYLMLAVNSTFS